jgi:phospholipase C
MPANFTKLAPEDIQKINSDPLSSSLMPHQERGVRPACPLPYQLYADGALDSDKKTFTLKMQAGNEVFASSENLRATLRILNS